MKYRPIWIALVALVAGYIPLPALAQQQAAQLTAADIAKIKTDVADAARAYMRTFSERNAKGVAENIYSQPSFSIGANGVAINDPAKQIVQLEANMKRQAETGWDKSVFPNPNVCVLNANVALASGRFYRYKKDGSLHSEGAETDLFARTKDGWRMVSLIGHDVTKVVTCTD